MTTASVQKQTTHGRVLALDGLRAVSILIVAFSHIFLLIGIGHIPGGLGVTIFFFISGFIITTLLLKEHVDTGAIQLAPFYIRRLFRLSPALIVYVVICMVVLAVLNRPIPRLDIAAVLFYSANYYHIYRNFSDVNHGILSPFVITWSLAVEEHFYFLFPVLLAALRTKTKRLLAVLIGFIVVVAVWRMYLVYVIGIDALPPLRIYEATDTRLDSIAYGCLLSVVFYRAQFKGDRTARRFLDALQGIRGVAVAAAFFLLSFGIRDIAFRNTLMYSAQGIALTGLFCSLFWGQSAPRWLKVPLENRQMVFIGAISYSLYLYHYLALVVAQLTLRSPLQQVLFAWLFAILGSLGSFYLVERPIRKIGANWASRISANRKTAGVRVLEN
jgi:peptidoglycan/LPS O-acetylase OafA/YrhL